MFHRTGDACAHDSAAAAADPGGTLSLHLRPSARLTIVLAGAHLGAAACVLAAALPLFAKGLLGALVLASMWHSIRRDARLRGADAVRELHWTGAGEWRLTLRSGRTLNAQLRPGSYVHASLVVLSLRLGPGGRRRTLVLLPEMAAPAHALRRLRQRLRAG